MAVNISVENVTSDEMPPPWAAAATTIPGISLSSEIEPTLVSPLTSKETRPWYIAGFTCDECPNKYRPHIARNGDIVRRQTFCLSSAQVIWDSAWQASDPESVGIQFTKRCRYCSSRMRTWTRSKKLANHITETAEINRKRLRFVTLTLPNYTDVEFGIKDLKKKIRNFRYTKAYQNKVIGSADFYEWTDEAIAWEEGMRSDELYDEDELDEHDLRVAQAEWEAEMNLENDLYMVYDDPDYWG